MAVKPYSQVNLKAQPIPKSLTKKIPLPVEVTAISVGAFFLTIPFIGWFMSVFATSAAGSTILNRYQTEAQAIINANEEKRREKYELMAASLFIKRQQAKMEKEKTVIAQQQAILEKQKADEKQAKADEKQAKAATAAKQAVITALCCSIIGILAFYFSSNYLKEDYQNTDLFCKNTSVLIKGAIFF